MTPLGDVLAGPLGDELAALARIRDAIRAESPTAPIEPPAIEWPETWGPEHIELRAEAVRQPHGTLDLLRAYPREPWASCRACTDGWVGRLNPARQAFQVPCRCRGLRRLAARVNAAELPASVVRRDLRLETLDWAALDGLSATDRSWADVLGDGQRLRRIVPRVAVYAFADSWGPYRRGLLLTGPNGNGKSHIAAGLALRLLFAGVSVRWLAWADYLARIKATFGAQTDDGRQRAEDGVRRPYVECDLLVLEELGGAQRTEWVGAQAEDLIYWRHMTDRPIVVTTNLALGGEATDRGTLLGYVGERAYSRLMGSCDVVHVRSRDWRTQHLASGRIT